ncbi:MAG: biopolymer transporter ExbD [Planctomycetota bacterium]
MVDPSSRLRTAPSMTPLIDVTFLLLIFLMLLPMRSLERQVAAFLPRDGCTH